MTDFPEGIYLTPNEAARLKGVTRSAVYLAIAEGRLPGHRFLRRLALKRSEVMDWKPVRHGGRRTGIAVSKQTRRRMSAAQKRRRAMEAGLPDIAATPLKSAHSSPSKINSVERSPVEQSRNRRRRISKRKPS